MAFSKEASRYVSKLMDHVGFSYDQIKYRQQIFSEIDKLYRGQGAQCCKRVTTGGKGEGTALLLESDIDNMLIVKDVICADNPRHFNHHANTTLLQTERHETPPGYTRLKLVKFHGRHYRKYIRSSLFESETGSLYLSSTFYIDKIAELYDNKDGIKMERSGPSVPFCANCQSSDNVYCFKIFCPDILGRWMSRSRYYGWPSLDTIHAISVLDGHAVPVGYKGSEDVYREWRICYSLAELHLMRNLNETQLKVYVVLKIICKSVLKPVCREMTSYIMKNVLLWMCELKGRLPFTRELILDRLFECIAYLSKCISVNSLPSYMIPERNLLAGRLDVPQKKQLICILSGLLNEGGRLFLRCAKFRDAMIVMHKTPYAFREFSEKGTR